MACPAVSSLAYSTVPSSLCSTTINTSHDREDRQAPRKASLVARGRDRSSAPHSAGLKIDWKARIKAQWPAFVILLVAAAARLTLLGMKPPHFDEGVNGWFVDQITHTGFYHYDPTNYHGPFHFYVLFLAQTLLGRHIWALRLPLALMSLATVALTIRFDRFIGRGAALWAAAAMAVSPGCVFYGRYAIHEYWLVFSLMLGAWGLAGLWKSGEKKYLWAVWIGITLAVLTKETYVIHIAACLLTVPCLWILGKATPVAETEPAPAQEWTWQDMALGALIFVVCVAFFYSGGFMDLPGLKGLYQCFAAWAQTGRTGNGHEKAWYYWLKLFGRYEWPSSAWPARRLPDRAAANPPLHPRPGNLRRRRPRRLQHHPLQDPLVHRLADLALPAPLRVRRRFRLAQVRNPGARPRGRPCSPRTWATWSR